MKKNGKKYLYALVRDENNKNHFTLYYAQAELNYYDKELYKASPAVENIKQTMVFEDEELSNIFKFDKIFYCSNINANLFSFYDYLNTKTP